MKLSIITINFNNKDGLRKTIDSVISQTYRDFEWIIIDGGSFDGSKDLIEQNSKYISYWVSESDNGIYNAMNKGIVEAHGDWLLFLNSGDWLFDESILEKVVVALNNTSADVIYGDKMQWIPDNSHLHAFPDELSFDYLVRYSICHQATFYRRELFAREQYDESYSIASDWAFDIKLMIQGKRFEHLSIPICYYDNTGISAQGSDIQKWEREEIIERYIPYHIRLDLERFDRYQHLYNGRFCSALTKFCLAFLEKVSKIRDHLNRKSF